MQTQIKCKEHERRMRNIAAVHFGSNQATLPCAASKLQHKHILSYHQAILILQMLLHDITVHLPV